MRMRCSAFLVAFGVGTHALDIRAEAQRAGYIGDAACAVCHVTQAGSYNATAHHRTSQLPTASSVHGVFTAGGNRLTVVDPANAGGEPGLWFVMEANGGRFTETAVTGYEGHLLRQSADIDIVTGSGKRGQTFLSWQGDALVELPVSYWTDGARWINSPGYSDRTANFSRPIPPGCIECHASYLKPVSVDANSNRFQRDTFVPGIACETCHGPGEQHVAKHRMQPKTMVADEAILNPAHFSRERQLDLCAQCHNGIQRQPLSAAFSYVPGKALAEYFKPLPGVEAEHPDVHGNQVGLLERSRCFRESAAMTCSTCHNTHEPEKSASSYSQTCLSCHSWQACPKAKRIGAASTSRCVDCHMPLEPTSVIVSETAGQAVHATMRNHWIKVYPVAVAAGSEY